MTGDELRKVFLKYMEQHGHAIIPSAPLVPEHDPTVLFTTAGMHPLVSYLLGENHPLGRRLANVQKCLRTDDIEEVGDISHHTFFEMLGFWSLGDYWKQESLTWTLDFFTRVLGLDPERISVTVFSGDDRAPADEEAIRVWHNLNIPPERIYRLGRKDNWWGPVGKTGPCGPDSELFFDTGRPKHGEDCQPGCKCGKYIEIGNNVFMQYNQTIEGRIEPLKQRNIDVGLGFERDLCVLQGKEDVYSTDLFSGPIRRIKELEDQMDKRSSIRTEQAIRMRRIIADHVRAATILIGEGVFPSNVERGYICRRLIRRAVRCGRELGIDGSFTAEVAKEFIIRYQATYPDLERQQSIIINEFEQEEGRFRHTLERGMHEFRKQVTVLHQVGEKKMSGEIIFHLFDTYGFPPNLSAELALEQNLEADLYGFEDCFRKHQELARSANRERFSGGLADHSEQTTRLHTATHLLHQALRNVLGNQVQQKGSNITSERLRFDFSYPSKLTHNEIVQVEVIVNQQIESNLQINMEMMGLKEAIDSGALAFFDDRYPEIVKVYQIGDFSREVCGGPHVSHTGELGNFHVTKFEAIGQGTQRLRAVLSDWSFQ